MNARKRRQDIIRKKVGYLKMHGATIALLMDWNKNVANLVKEMLLSDEELLHMETYPVLDAVITENNVDDKQATDQMLTETATEVIFKTARMVEASTQATIEEKKDARDKLRMYCQALPRLQEPSQRLSRFVKVKA